VLCTPDGTVARDVGLGRCHAHEAAAMNESRPGKPVELRVPEFRSLRTCRAVQIAVRRLCCRDHYDAVAGAGRPHPRPNALASWPRQLATADQQTAEERSVMLHTRPSAAGSRSWRAAGFTDFHHQWVGTSTRGTAGAAQRFRSTLNVEVGSRRSAEGTESDDRR
jgi:hypothetical protein